MLANDPGKRIVKRLVLAVLVVFAGGWLLAFAAAVAIVEFDLPAEPVAWAASGFLMVGAVVFAIIMGRRNRSDRERATHQTDPSSETTDKPPR